MQTNAGVLTSRFLAVGLAVLGTGAFAQSPEPAQPLRAPPLVTAEPAPPAQEPALPPLADSGRTGRIKYRGDAVPAGFHVVDETRWGLVGGGIGAFAGGYVLTAGIGVGANQWTGLVPLVGPFLQAAGFWATGGFFSGFSNFFVVILTAVEFAAQVAGVVMVWVGLASPSRWLERDTNKPQAFLVPGAAGSPLGASLVGRF